MSPSQSFKPKFAKHCSSTFSRIINLVVMTESSSYEGQLPTYLKNSTAEQFCNEALDGTD